jgi:hypothetical protein
MREEFLKELKALLKKYDVTIGFSVSECSDTHGLHDDKLVIEHKPDPTKYTFETWLEVDGWWLHEDDIKVD